MHILLCTLQLQKVQLMKAKPIKVTKDAEGKYSYAADQNAADATDDMVTVESKIDGQDTTYILTVLQQEHII